MQEEIEAGLTIDFLLRTVLAWYADPSNWASRGTFTPYSASSTSAASRDGGQAAARAMASRGVGGLVLVVLDLVGTHVNELARASEIKVTRVSEIVHGSEVTVDEGRRLRSAISSLSARKSG